jgi:formylmethanofuran dehydrogenase subunit D
MITYVNTVLVSNKNGEGLATAKELAGSASLSGLDSMVGKFAFMNCDPCTSGGG